MSVVNDLEEVEPAQIWICVTQRVGAGDESFVWLLGSKNASGRYEHPGFPRPYYLSEIHELCWLPAGADEHLRAIRMGEILAFMSVSAEAGKEAA